MRRYVMFLSLVVVIAMLAVLLGCGGSGKLPGEVTSCHHRPGHGGGGGGGGDGGTPPSGEAIVFAGFHGAIKAINPDGSGEFQVTRSGNRPSWSPDGSQIVFGSYAGKGKQQSRELFIINVDGTGRRQLTNTPDLEEFDPDWSPGGIVFTAAPGDLNDLDGRDIWVIDADGTGLQNLTNSPGIADSFPSWSLDGTQIAWEWHRLDPEVSDSQIYTMNADGSSSVKLTDDHSGVNFFPAWSPDGARIAFVSSRDGNYEVYVLDVGQAAAGNWGQEVNVTQDPAYDTDPAWSADGSQIVFSSARGVDRGSQGFVMNADGSAVQLIYADSFTSPDWRAAP